MPGRKMLCLGVTSCCSLRRVHAQHATLAAAMMHGGGHHHGIPGLPLAAVGAAIPAICMAFPYFGRAVRRYYRLLPGHDRWAGRIRSRPYG